MQMHHRPPPHLILRAMMMDTGSQRFTREEDLSYYRLIQLNRDLFWKKDWMGDPEGEFDLDFNKITGKHKYKVLSSFSRQNKWNRTPNQMKSWMKRKKTSFRRLRKEIAEKSSKSGGEPYFKNPQELQDWEEFRLAFTTSIRLFCLESREKNQKNKLQIFRREV